jgi:hypothetical protein
MSVDRIWVRTPTQFEVDEIREKIAEARMKVREKYAPGTVLYQDLADSLDLLSTATLAERVAENEAEEIQGKAERGIPKPMVPDWSKYVTEKEREKALDDHQARLNEYESQVAARAGEMTNNRIEQLIATPRAELIEQCIKPSVQTALAQETQKLYQAYTVLYAVRYEDDHDKMYFEDVEGVIDIMNGAPMVAQMIASALNEITLARPCDIKNSQGKSVLPSGLAENTPEPTEDPSTNDSQE